MNKNIISDIKFNTILKYADLLCPNEYNSKYTNEYYLKNILYVLNNFISWKSLQYSKLIESDKEYHYKTIHKKHILWSNANVYYYAYNDMLNNNTINNITENIIIDNTLIINKYGSQEIGYGNGETRKKKYISLTAVINENNKPVLIFNNNTIKKENINTLPHDTKSLINSIDLLKNKIKNNTCIIGDKGYIIDKNKINNKYIKIVTPKRKNQKEKNTEEEKQKLKTRYKIENWFSKLKNFNRILVRRDKLIKTYMGINLNFFRNLSFSPSLRVLLVNFGVCLFRLYVYFIINHLFYD